VFGCQDPNTYSKNQYCSHNQFGYGFATDGNFYLNSQQNKANPNVVAYTKGVVGVEINFKKKKINFYFNGKKITPM
jgi:hypothetical protein